MKARQLGSRTLALPSVLNSETQPEHWTVGVLIKRRFIDMVVEAQPLSPAESRIEGTGWFSHENDPKRRFNATQVVLKTPIRAGRINRFS